MQYPGVTDNLVAVKDYGIFQMLTRRIERADIVAFIIPWVFNKLDAVIASCPFIKLFLQIAYNDIYLIDAVCMERFDYRVDHTHSVYRNQRLRRGKRHGLKALADNRRDYYRALHCMFCFRHMPLRTFSCIHRKILKNTPLHSHTAAGHILQSLSRSGA